MKFLSELSEDVKFEVLEEGKTKNYYLEGLTLKGDEKNKNGRIYPTSVLEDAVKKHKNIYMDTARGALGELNHPSENVHEINFKNVSHQFLSITQEGTSFIAKAKVLDTPNGKILKNLIDEGITPGISSRGFGQVQESNGVKIVKTLNLISIGDVVSNPSCHNAFVQGIMESKEWVYENGVLSEKSVEVEEQIDTFQKAIKKASKSELTEVSINCFKEYFKTLGIK